VYITGRYLSDQDARKALIRKRVRPVYIRVETIYMASVDKLSFFSFISSLYVYDVFLPFMVNKSFVYIYIYVVSVKFKLSMEINRYSSIFQS
jgi:hypothetical protein